MNYNNQFQTELAKLLQAEIDRLTENLINPASVIDYSDYKMQAGKITALRSVFDMFEEVSTILSKR